MARDIPGAVSLWVGVSPSREALESYVEMDYTKSDTSRLSQFADDFGTDFYDEDFMEVWADEATRSLPELLRGCSYDSLIIPKFVVLCGETLPFEANSAVVLYDFRHDGTVGQHGPWNCPVKLRYMGSIKVDVPWPTSSDW
jgi:hypothetical protein